jgi:type IV secretion system protein VirB1
MALAATCAPNVAPATLAAIVQVESGFNALAIGVNGTPRVTVAATTAADAGAKAKALIAAGRSVDLGLAQINSKNLAWLGLRVEDAFDPCRNLAAGARVLQAGYTPTSEGPAEQQAALRVALSRYNTGDARRGFANGYVGKVARAAGAVVPALEAEARPAAIAALPPPPAEAWDVFAQAQAGDFLIRVTTTTEGAAP